MSSCRCTRHCECWDAAAFTEAPHFLQPHLDHVHWSFLKDAMETTSKQIMQMYETLEKYKLIDDIPQRRTPLSSNKELFKVALSSKEARKPRWTYQWDYKTHA